MLFSHMLEALENENDADAACMGEEILSNMQDGAEIPSILSGAPRANRLLLEAFCHHVAALDPAD